MTGAHERTWWPGVGRAPRPRRSPRSGTSTPAAPRRSRGQSALPTRPTASGGAFPARFNAAPLPAQRAGGPRRTPRASRPTVRDRPARSPNPRNRHPERVRNRPTSHSRSPALRPPGEPRKAAPSPADARARATRDRARPPHTFSRDPQDPDSRILHHPEPRADPAWLRPRTSKCRGVLPRDDGLAHAKLRHTGPSAAAKNLAPVQTPKPAPEPNPSGGAEPFGCRRGRQTPARHANPGGSGTAIPCRRSWTRADPARRLTALRSRKPRPDLRHSSGPARHAPRPTSRDRAAPPGAAPGPTGGGALRRRAPGGSRPAPAEADPRPQPPRASPACGRKAGGPAPALPRLPAAERFKNRPLAPILLPCPIFVRAQAATAAPKR